MGRQNTHKHLQFVQLTEMYSHIQILTLRSTYAAV